MGIVISNNKRLLLTCPICTNRAIVMIKGSIEVDVIGITKNGVNMIDSFIHSEFSCPICGSKMRIDRDAINRIIDIIEKMVSSGLVVKTYTNPKFNGVKVINEMLVDDHTYPSLVIIHEEDEVWEHEVCNLIDTIIQTEAFDGKLEVHKDLVDIRGAIFIKLNEEKFNNYFIEAKAPMHTFVTVAEEYFLDLIDLLANELEDIYDFNHKGEK